MIIDYFKKKKFYFKRFLKRLFCRHKWKMKSYLTFNAYVKYATCQKCGYERKFEERMKAENE